MQSSPFTVDPLWVSSRDHLTDLAAIYQANPWYKKLFGGLSVPEDFPCVQIQRNFFPLVYYSSGIMEFKGPKLTYLAQQRQGRLGSTYFNVNNSLQFEIEAKDLKSLNRFRPERMPVKHFTINWVELDISGFEQPILVCVGGSGPSMKRIHDDTDKLYQTLNAWISS